jgi:hypothetical protein
MELHANSSTEIEAYSDLILFFACPVQDWYLGTFILFP